SGWLAKAIRRPSGDHDGWKSLAGCRVRVRRPLPSAFITQPSKPSPSHEKAILAPARADPAAAAERVTRVGAAASAVERPNEPPTAAEPNPRRRPMHKRG